MVDLALKTSHVSIRSVNFTPDRSFIAELNAQAKFDWINSDRASTEDDGTTDAPTDGQTGNPPTSDQSSSGNQPSGNNGASDIPDDVVFPGT